MGVAFFGAIVQKRAKPWVWLFWRDSSEKSKAMGVAFLAR